MRLRPPFGRRRTALVASLAVWVGACQTSRASDVPSASSEAPSPQSLASPKAAVPSSSPLPQQLYLPRDADGQRGATPHAAASASGAAPSKPSKKPTPMVYRVAAVGDSLTDTRSHGGKYLTYLQRQCPESTFDNYGVGGEMVNQMRRRFVRQVLATAGRYTHVLVFGGVNDLYSDLTAGRTPEKISRDLAWMYQQAHDAGIEVVALTVAPWGGFRRYFNAKRSESTKKLNQWIQRESGADAVVDAYALLSCGDPERLCPEYMKPFRDGLHFGERGHEVLGKALHESVFASCR